MTRPAPDSDHPFTRSDVVSIAGVGAPTIKNLQKGKVLRKRQHGTGNYVAYDLDDLLRIMLSKELLRTGLLVSSIHSLFDAIQTPTAPSAKPWSWLRSAEAHDEGALLVLLAGHPMGPNGAHTGQVYLTTLDDAVNWLRVEYPGLRKTFIDVGGLIKQIEERTGRRYE